MSLSRRLAALFSFILASSVSATPISVAGPIPLSRSLSRPRTGPIEGIFDPRGIDYEFRKIQSKYGTHAIDYLKGINIVSENDIVDFVGNHSFALPLNDSSQEPIPAVVPLHTLPMKDFSPNGMDLLYYANLSFGTPIAGSDQQVLSVDVDTGSADLWVPSACRNCVNAQFNPDESSTFKNLGRPFSIVYGSGSVQGHLGQDRVVAAGLEILNQTFALVSEESEDFMYYPNDGLMGLAFGTIARSRKPTVAENLIKDKKIAPFFSVHLTRNAETGSEVCFGCYDATKTVGKVHWIPVKSRTYWSIVMDGFVVNSQRAYLTDNIIFTAVDTGTTLIYFPNDLAQKLYSMIQDAQQWDDGYWTFPCDSDGLEIAFTFGQKDFAVNLVDFNLGRISPSSNRCVGGILSLNDDEAPSNLIILGDLFLKSWYSVYSYENRGRVGFAPSINNR